MQWEFIRLGFQSDVRALIGQLGDIVGCTIMIMTIFSIARQFN